MPSRSLVRPLFVAPLILSLAAVATGCGGPPALRVKASEPSTFAGVLPGQPIIVEFNEGDVVPLTLSIDGELFETKPPPPPIQLVAKRRFFVRVDGSGIRTSIDGEHWNASRKKGSFAFGFGFTKEGTRADAKLVTPSYTP